MKIPSSFLCTKCIQDSIFTCLSVADQQGRHLAHDARNILWLALPFRCVQYEIRSLITSCYFLLPISSSVVRVSSREKAFCCTFAIISGAFISYVFHSCSVNFSPVSDFTRQVRPGVELAFIYSDGASFGCNCAVSHLH